MRVGDTSFSLTRQAEGLVAWQKAMDLIPTGRLTKFEEFRIRGNFYSDTWDFAKSVEVYETFSTYYPNSHIPLKFRAMPLLRLGRIQESVEVIHRALAIAPALTMNFLDLALHQAAAGQAEQAREALETARKPHPLWTGRVGSVVAFLLGDYDRIQQELDLADQGAWPWQSVIARIRAYFLSERGQWDRALEILDRALRMDEKNGLLAEQFAKRLSIAALHFRSSNYAAGKRTLEVALGQPMDMALHTAAVSLLARNGAIAEASQWLAALPVTPVVLQLHALRYIAQGEIALALGDNNKGERLMREASRLLPPLWPREFLAFALGEVGKHQEANTILEKGAKEKAAIHFSRTLPMPSFWGNYLSALVKNPTATPEQIARWRAELAKLQPA